MKIIFLLILIIAMFGCGTTDKKAEVPPIANINGEELFKSCASCHKCDVDFTGPALKGSLQRWGDKALMYEFIRNPMVMSEKNEYARNLKRKWNGVQMTAFELSDRELDAIFNYCENFTQGPVADYK